MRDTRLVLKDSKWINHLILFGQREAGYQIVKVFLKNGDIFDGIVVVDFHIMLLPFENLFSESKIVNIEVSPCQF